MEAARMELRHRSGDMVCRSVLWLCHDCSPGIICRSQILLCTIRPSPALLSLRLLPVHLYPCTVPLGRASGDHASCIYIWSVMHFAANPIDLPENGVFASSKMMSRPMSKEKMVELPHYGFEKANASRDMMWKFRRTEKCRCKDISKSGRTGSLQKETILKHRPDSKSLNTN